MNSPVSLSEAIAAVIDGRPVEFRLAAVPIEISTRLGELDEWRISLTTDRANTPFTFKYLAGLGHRRPAKPLQPYPMHVLAKIAGDVALALLLPADKGLGVDMLLDDGYAVYVADAWRMWHKLTDTRNAMEVLLAGSGVSPAAFAAWAIEGYQGGQARCLIAA